MNSTGDTPKPNELHRADDRTDILLVEDGIVVYDVENPDAWIESDESVPLVERR